MGRGFVCGCSATAVQAIEGILQETQLVGQRGSGTDGAAFKPLDVILDLLLRDLFQLPAFVLTAEVDEIIAGFFGRRRCFQRSFPGVFVQARFGGRGLGLFPQKLAEIFRGFRAGLGRIQQRLTGFQVSQQGSLRDSLDQFRRELLLLLAHLDLEAPELIDKIAIRSRLEPIKRVARMIKGHLQGVLNAIVAGVSNARLEALNATIQWLKRSARGFRNRERFRNAIYFHLGGLDLYPASVLHPVS